VEAARLFCATATAEERTELIKLAARVDAMSVQPETNRFHYLTSHEKLHHRIAECARCQALCDAIERTRALSSTWLCVARAFSSGSAPRRHQELMEVLAVTARLPRPRCGKTSRPACNAPSSGWSRISKRARPRERRTREIRRSSFQSAHQGRAR